MNALFYKNNSNNNVIMSRISIIGSGFVGFEVGKGLSALGNDVIFHDVSDARLSELAKLGYKTTKSIKEAINKSDISFIAVPTPTVDGKFDSSYIKSVSEEIGKVLKSKTSYHLIAIKSTVLPGLTEEMIIPTIEKFSSKKAGRDFGVCVNPEFLTQINKSWTDEKSFKRNFFNDERIVIGELDKKSGDMLESLYASMKVPIFRMKIKEAEFLKYTANCALSAKLSYWNEIFLIGKELGLENESIQKIAEIVGLDSRIGKYGTILGKAFGGKCLPKDLQAMIIFLEEEGINSSLLKSVNEVNKQMAKKYGIRE